MKCKKNKGKGRNTNKWQGKHGKKGSIERGFGKEGGRREREVTQRWRRERIT